MRTNEFLLSLVVAVILAITTGYAVHNMPSAVSVNRAALDTNQTDNSTSTVPPTNTKRPSLVTATPTATEAVTSAIIPNATSTATPTVIPTNTPAGEASPSAGPTQPLPTVPGRSTCTTKTQPTAIPSPAPRLSAPGNDIMNIALLGTDADVDPTDPSFRTDAIMIVSINRTTNTVAMLSIPRDLIVCIPELGMQRVNVAFNWGSSVKWTPGGGFGLFQEMILYNFGIPVHYYAKISLKGFKQIIDSLKGVDLAVDCPIRNELRYEGNDDQGTPVYKPESMEIGYYHMNGTVALWYARSRHNTSDFDRNRRQQQLLKAIWLAARQQGLIQQAPQLWGQLTQIVDTNLQLPDVLGLVPMALNMSLDDITTYYMVKGAETQHWTTPQNEDVQVPLEPGMSQMLKNFYTPPTKNKIKAQSVSVDIYNGSANDNWDKVAESALLSRGFKAQAQGKTDPTAQTVIYDYTGGADADSVAALARLLNAPGAKVISQPDPNRTADFRVVLGDNYNSCSAAGFGGISPKPPKQ